MVGPVESEDSIWDWVSTGILLSFVAAGIAGVAMTMYVWTEESNVPGFLIDAGPFLLVLVTLINIGLSGLGFLEARKERRLTRDTLAEYRKDGIIETIVRLIETKGTELRKDEETLEEAQEPPVTYPNLLPMEEPDIELLQDLSPHYSEITDDFREYFELRDDYTCQRDALEKQLTDYIPEDLSNGCLDELLQATGSSLESVSPNAESDSFYQRLSAHSDDLTHIVLMREASTLFTKMWLKDNSEEILKALNQLRSTDEFEDQFEELETLQADMLEKSKEIQRRSSEAKFVLKERYNISEAEVMERKERMESET